jgi:streptogramin lyase
VNRFDEQLKHSLHALSADITPDSQDLLTVRRRAAAARRRTRRAWGLAALAIAGVIAVLVVVLGAGHVGRQEPVGPLPSPSTPTPGGLRNPFTVVRSIEASTVRIRGPLKVAVAPNGHVYVTDRGQHITELSDSGAVLRRWGGPGTAPGKFRLYSGAVAVGPDGRVYVADTGNFRIQVFSPSGRFLTQYGSYGQAPGRFVWPSDIAVGTDGTMYVADDRAATITALSPTGEQLWRRGTPAETDPDLVGHEHLGGVTSAGELVTANDDVGKVLFLGARGAVLDEFSTDAAGARLNASGVPGGHFPNGACGAALDPGGYVYVSSCEESYALRHDTAVYDQQHRLVAGWRRGVLADPPVFGPNGHAWAVQGGNRTLLELTVNLPRD